MTEARRKVLVVEDEEDVRDLLQHTLRMAGFHATATGESRSVAYHVLALDPDLILCDISMPERDGYGVVEALQADPATAGYPVVFLTAYAAPENRKRAKDLGVVDFMVKPITPEVLLARLEGIFAGLARRATVRVAGMKGLRGEVAVLGAPGLLELCRVNQLTGVLTLRRRERSARLGFSRGDLVSADAGGRQGDEAVLELMGWTDGNFEFQAGEPPGVPAVEHSLPYLLIEGCRRLDERNGRSREP
jgi:CheY-like chemotaxis protein